MHNERVLITLLHTLRTYRITTYRGAVARVPRWLHVVSVAWNSLLSFRLCRAYHFSLVEPDLTSLRTSFAEADGTRHTFHTLGENNNLDWYGRARGTRHGVVVVVVVPVPSIGSL